MQITDLFNTLRDHPTGHEFNVVSVPGRSNVFLGSDVSDKPCLFLRASESTIEPPLRTSHVALLIGQEFKIAEATGVVRKERLHALICETSDQSDVDTFLVLVEAFLNQYSGEELTKVSFKAFFRSMVRLFSAGHSEDLQTERQGLWGELFVMSRVKGFRFWSPFWHSETTRKFDFSTSNKHVEIKTTIGSDRIHHFSHRQIFALVGEEIMIASILLRKEEAGLSLRELIQQARDEIGGSEQYLKLEQAVRQAGMERLDENGPAYDATEAELSLAWYRSTDAPHFRMSEPPGVSQTHYRVDLSTAPQLDPHELYQWLESWSGSSLPLLLTPQGR